MKVEEKSFTKVENNKEKTILYEIPWNDKHNEEKLS